jgi:hypothetical protein
MTGAFFKTLGMDEAGSVNLTNRLFTEVVQLCRWRLLVLYILETGFRANSP